MIYPVDSVIYLLDNWDLVWSVRIERYVKCSLDRLCKFYNFSVAIRY